VGYRPRDAEHAVLYRVIDEQLEAFLQRRPGAIYLMRRAVGEAPGKEAHPRRS
jgi:hypothetical protein